MVGRLIRRTLHAPQVGPNDHRRQIVHDGRPEAREDAIDRQVPGLEAASVSGLGEELPGFLWILRAPSGGKGRHALDSPRDAGRAANMRSRDGAGDPGQDNGAMVLGVIGATFH
jgi:hypothetical protein